MQVRQQRGTRPGATGVYSIVFCVLLSLLSSFVFLSPLLLQLSTYYKMLGGHKVELDMTGPTRVMAATRGKEGQPS